MRHIVHVPHPFEPKALGWHSCPSSCEANSAPERPSKTMEVNKDASFFLDSPSISEASAKARIPKSGPGRPNVSWHPPTLCKSLIEAS